MLEETLLSQEQFVWLLGAACQLHRIPFAPQLVIQQFPPPHTLAAARQALEELGFRSGLTETPLEGIFIEDQPRESRRWRYGDPSLPACNDDTRRMAA